MNYELQYFDQFIHQFLPSVAENYNPEDLEGHKKLLREESAGVRSRMIIHIFSFKRQSGIEIYIQQHQSALIALSDALLAYMDKHHITGIYRLSKTNAFINLCKLCYQSLEEILFFIETYFSKYFSQDVKLPEVHRIIAKRELDEKIPLLEEVLRDKGTSADLLDAALSPLRKFVASTGSDTSYRRLIWLKELVSELNQISGAVLLPEQTLDEELIKILCYLNLNSLRFYNYCVDRFAREISVEPTSAAQIERINWLLKNLNQLQQKPCFALRKHRPSIKEMLTCWLTEEVHYIGQKGRLGAEIKDVTTEERFKVMTSISVPQLAYLLRLFVETGVLNGQNLSGLIRFFAEHFTSLRAERISAVSFRMKYYNTDRATAGAVRDFLLKMVHHSKRGIA